MTTKQVEQFAKRMLQEEKVRDRKFFILGLNRDKPGFGDDLALVTRKTGSLALYPGDPVLERPAGRLFGSDVVIPEEAKQLRPGSTAEVSYAGDSSEEEILMEDDGEEAGAANAYRIQTGRPDQDIFFRINASGDGVELVEDRIGVPLVCWNTGSLPVTVDGHNIPGGEYYIHSHLDPERKDRRLRYEDIMSLPIWDSKQQIAKAEKALLARGCPAGDAHALAVYFYRDPADDAEDYDPANHAEWMERARVEGKPASRE